MFDIDRNQYTFSASLPAACRELYENVKNLELDFPENPILKLSDAIRYSLETKGKYLNSIIHGSKTFIRIPCGFEQAYGNGIPYVLEIWPKGLASKVHNHGNSCAVIKVLFGQIRINIYNKGW